MAIPTRRPGSSPSSLKAKSPGASPTWGRHHSPSAAIRSRKLTRPSPRRWPVRPATLSSYARQGGSITTKAMPGPEEHCSGRWSWTPTTSWPSSSTPGRWTAAATRLPPQVLPAGPPQAPAGRGSALLLWTFARRGGEGVRRLPASRLQRSVSERQAQDRKLAQTGPPACPNAQNEQDQLKRFEAIYAERQEVWK